jgi:hypothetical protein
MKPYRNHRPAHASGMSVPVRLPSGSRCSARRRELFHLPSVRVLTVTREAHRLARRCKTSVLDDPPPPTLHRHVVHPNSPPHLTTLTALTRHRAIRNGVSMGSSKFNRGFNKLPKIQQGFQWAPQKPSGVSMGSLKLNRGFNGLLKIQQGFQKPQNSTPREADGCAGDAAVGAAARGPGHHLLRVSKPPPCKLLQPPIEL